MASATSNNKYHPITEVFRDMQKSVLPDNMEDNVASRWIEVISDATKHEGDGVDDWLIREVGSRVAALVLPIFVALATVQLAGVLVCQMTLAALMQEHGDIGKCGTDLLRMIGALFTSVIAWPFSIIDPKVYKRDEKSSPHGTDLEAQNEFLKKENALLKDSLVEALESKKTRGSLPSWEELEGQEKPPGATAQKYKESDFDGDVRPIGTWDKRHGGSAITIKNEEHFLCPEGTVEVACDFEDSAHFAQLIAFMGETHKVDRLQINKGDLTHFLKLAEDSMLEKVHTLVLRNMTFSVEDLQKIAAKFTNIACFDLKTCTIEGETDELEKTHIVLVNGVKFESSVQKHYDDLNAHLEAFVGGYSSRGFAKRLYTGNPLKKCRHPAAPFIRTVSFLRDTEIRDSHFKSLVTELNHFFPNMTVLDLADCDNLSVGVLSCIRALASTPQDVELVRCGHVMYKRLHNSLANHFIGAFQTLNQPLQAEEQVFFIKKSLIERLEKRERWETLHKMEQSGRLAQKEIASKDGEALQKEWDELKGQEAKLHSLEGIELDAISTKDDNGGSKYKISDRKVFQFVSDVFTKGIMALIFGGIETIRLDDVESEESIQACIDKGIRLAIALKRDDNRELTHSIYYGKKGGKKFT